MNCAINILEWNANGILQHRLELEQFLNTNAIDIALISETHLTSKNCLKIRNYTCYQNNNTNDRPQGGTAILIQKRIKHHAIMPNFLYGALESLPPEVVIWYWL